MWGLDENFRQKFGLYYSDYGKYKAAEFLNNKTCHDLKKQIEDLKQKSHLRFGLNCALVCILSLLGFTAILHIPVSTEPAQEWGPLTRSLSWLHGVFMKVETLIPFDVNMMATFILVLALINIGLIWFILFLCRHIRDTNGEIETLSENLESDVNKQIHLGAGKFYFSYGHDGIALNRHKGHLAILWGAVDSVDIVELSYGKKKSAKEEIKGQALKIFLNATKGSGKRDFIIIPAKEFYDSQYNAMSCDAFCAGLEYGIKNGNLENFSYIQPEKDFSLADCKLYPAAKDEKIEDDEDDSENEAASQSA